MKRKFTNVQELQICDEYFSEEEPSCKILAEKWNSSYSIIRNIIIRNKYVLRSCNEARKIFTKEQEKQICNQYIVDKLNTVVLAEKWSCTSSTIGNIIKRNGYKLRNSSEAAKGSYSIFTKEQKIQICNEYFSEEKPSVAVLGKKWGCDSTTIAYIIKQNEYVLRTNGEASKKFTREEELQICDEYFSKEKPSAKILAKRWGCAISVIGNTIKRNGYKLRTASTPEAIQRILKNGYGKKCYYNNEFFPSNAERDCYIKLRKLSFKVKHNFEGRFDFLVLVNNKKVVVEFHPFDFKLTDKQYYIKRRKLLDKYGYKDLKLIVIKDLKEIENKLGNEI